MSVLSVEDHGAVRLLILNRPDKHNALDTELTQALLAALDDAEHVITCRAVVLAGNGASFCSGADTTEFRGFSSHRRRARIRADLTMQVHQIFSSLSKPVVAAVHGNALGGGAGLALACDMTVVAADTRFGYPELNHGICPAIVMANLTHQLGPKRAFELVSTARLLDGKEMEAWGIANRCVAGVGKEGVLQTARNVAEQWAGYSEEAVSATKRLFHRCADLNLKEGIRCGRDANVMMRGFTRDE